MFEKSKTKQHIRKNLFDFLVIGIWDLFVIWHLLFGAYLIFV